jgi:hypothetical protein
MKSSVYPYTILLLVIITGSMLIGCDEKAGIKNFPHNVHIEQEIACDTCHELEANQVTRPTFETCVACHDVEDDIFANCNQCHEQHNVKVTEESIINHSKLLKSHLPDGWDDVQFAHSKHIENEQETCMGCHSHIKTSDRSSVKNLPTMEEAMAFNDKHGISNDCRVCHTRVTIVTEPASHNSAWLRKHGKMEPFMDKDRCLLCHQEETCTTCHRTELPRSHTNQWRKRTHGIQASFDRSSCLTCHRSDACASCHQTLSPHIPPAGYHTPASNCYACHAPVGGSRQAAPFVKLMPHRMMMGSPPGKCLSCHSF